jgi:hypothetical protein
MMSDGVTISAPSLGNFFTCSVVTLHFHTSEDVQLVSI